MCQLFCCSIIQGVSFRLPSENCEVSSLGLELPGLGLGFFDKVSVSSRNLSQVQVSEVTVSTTSLLVILAILKHFESRSTIYLYLAQSLGCRYGFMRDA